MINDILNALKVGIGMCRFKQTTADMPHAGKNHTAVLIFYAAIMLVVTIQLQSLFFELLNNYAKMDPKIAELMKQTGTPSLQQLILGGVLQLGALAMLYYGLLMMRNKTARFGQSVLAFLVINALFGILFALILPPMLNTMVQPEPSGIGALGGFILFPAAILNFIVIIRIIHDTIEVPWGVAFIALIALYYGASLVSNLVFFSTAGTAAA